MTAAHRLPPRVTALIAVIVAPAVTGCGVSPEFRDDPAYPVEHERAEPAPLPGDPALVGRYEGVGVQSNGPTWNVAVTVTDPSEGACAIVRFPDDGCTGYWQCTGVDGDRLEAVERITRGRDKCLDGVRIEATLLHGGRTLAFVAEAEGVRAAGKLRRVD